MFVERSIDGSPIDPNDDKYEKTNDTSHAERFLKAYPMAKIVVVIDTHCLDNGTFVWKGATPVEYDSCTLLDVRVGITHHPFNGLMLFRFSRTVPPEASSSIYPMRRIHQRTIIRR